MAATLVDFAHSIREIGCIVQGAQIAACLPDFGQ
jgi:hypothetical protein